MDSVLIHITILGDSPLVNTIAQIIKVNNLTSVLEIGCHAGEWLEKLRNLVKNPNLEIYGIDCNPVCEKHLVSRNINHAILCLGDAVGEEVNYYINHEGDGMNGGASIFKENGNCYTEGKYETVKKTTTTLDVLFPNKVYDMVILDTQGSELKIIRGGVNLINRCKFLVIEVATMCYNIGAPLKDEVFSHLIHLGFDPVLKLDEHKYENGEIFQEDYLFKNKKVNS